jgi:tetratricopeptide (TPR) repeat protein
MTGDDFQARALTAEAVARLVRGEKEVAQKLLARLPTDVPAEMVAAALAACEDAAQSDALVLFIQRTGLETLVDMIFDRARAEERHGNPAAAAPLFEVAHRLGSTRTSERLAPGRNVAARRADVLLRLGDAQLAAGQDLAAWAAFCEAFRTAISPAPLGRMVKLLRNQGRYIEALDLVSDWREVFGTTFDSEWQAALTMLVAGWLANAEATINALAQIDTREEVIALQALSAIAWGRPDDARRKAEKLGGSLLAKMVAGLLAEIEGRADDAIRIYRQAGTGSHPMVLVNLAGVLKRVGEVSESEDLLRQAERFHGSAIHSAYHLRGVLMRPYDSYGGEAATGNGQP